MAEKLDEKALTAALEAWEHGVGFHWDDVQRAIRAYLHASPSQVAPANPAQVMEAEISREPNGGWVRHSDYADLERQIAELRAEVDTLRQEESCHDEEIHGWEQDFEQERKLREAAEAENARLKALPLKDEVERVAAKEIATKFFRWWWNKPGANTDEGFDEWAETEGEALLSSLRAGEQEGEELPCERCGRPALVWFAPNELWNRVRGGPDATDDPGGILCPYCFILAAEKAGIRPTAWIICEEVLPAAPKQGESK